jgi:WD40 repeat protein
MDNNSKQFRDYDTLTLPECITRITTSTDLLAVSTIDNTISLWKPNMDNFNKDPFRTQQSSGMGVIDLAIDPTSQHLASSNLDSTIRILSLTDRTPTNHSEK